MLSVEYFERIMLPESISLSDTHIFRGLKGKYPNANPTNANISVSATFSGLDVDVPRQHNTQTS